MTRWLKWLAASASLAFLAACGGSDHDEEDAVTQNIVQVAAANPQFSILVEAVTAAELGGLLSGPGPFTVFAPTNDAFAALLLELDVTKAELLANKPLLEAVLTYHVLGSRVAKADVPTGLPITTAQGGFFKVEVEGTDLKITDQRNRKSTITATDIAATNGVIHVVDKVILPGDKTVVATAIAANPEFSILVEAILAADPLVSGPVVDALNGTGPFTVFAPTNAAFANLLAELEITKEALLADTALLTRVLTYHVVPGLVLKAQVPVGAAITPLLGAPETFTVSAGLVITDRSGRTSNIIATDVLASNGVIHVIDTVLLPGPL